MSDPIRVTVSQVTSKVIRLKAVGPQGPGIQQYTDYASFPAAGSTSLLYLAADTGLLYYWDGTSEQYVAAGSGAFDITIPINYLKFSTTAGDPTTPVEGQCWWNETDKALNIKVNGGDVILQVGQELFIRGKNMTGSTILNGVPVSIPTTDSSTGDRAKIEPTDISVVASCRCFVGITTEEIAHGDEGMVTRLGFVRGINTLAYNEGDRLWVTGVGGFTTTEPTSGNKVLAGMVIKKSADGIVLSNPRHFELTAEQASFTNSPTDTLDPTGFVDPDNITVTYDGAANTITLAHSSGTIEYYWRGTLKTLASPWTSSAHLTAATRYFLKSTDGTNFAWGTSSWVFSDIQVAIAIKDTPNNEWWAMREPHGLMPWQDHEEAHDLLGTYRKTGLGPTAGTYTVNTATDAATTPGFDAGTVKDEDCITTIALTSDGSYTTLRIGAASAATFDLAATFPFRSSGSFILVNTPSTGAEAATVTNRYVNVYELLIPACLGTTSQKRRRVLLQPQAAYTSLAAAQAEDFRSLSLGDLASMAPEYVAYSRITYVTSAGDVNTGKCRIATGGISYVVGSRSSQVSVTTGAVPTAENIVAAATAVNASVNVQAQIYEAQTETTITDKSDDYTFTLADAGKTFRQTATGKTFTVPANSSVPFPTGTVINIVGAGYDVTVAVTTDTLISYGDKVKVANKGVGTLIKGASTTWYLGGALA